MGTAAHLGLEMKLLGRIYPGNTMFEITFIIFLVILCMGERWNMCACKEILILCNLSSMFLLSGI
jgi:hypothetical protein